jgi:hypothetical protein
VYRLDTTGANFATIATFPSRSSGSGPSGLVRRIGRLYGTTPAASTPDGAPLVTGTAFSLPLTGPANLVWTFASTCPPACCRSRRADARQFYGVSCLGGWFGYGTVFGHRQRA